MTARLHPFPLPPTREGSPPSATAEFHLLVRERAFAPAPNILELLGLLHADRSTGTLTINITQGSVGSVTFREQHKVFPDQNKA